MKNLICTALFFTIILFATENCFAQGMRAPEKLDKKALPKLEKVVMGGPGVKVEIPSDPKEIISEAEVTNRAQNDGKVSKTEMRIIDRARKMPQEY
jgi:hypothetical protein